MSGKKMGKKKSDIYSCFEILPIKNKANKSIFMCRFCDRQYLQNATKMESHIVTQCQKVPHNIRLAYAKVGPSQSQIAQGQLEYANGNSGSLSGNTRPSPSLSSDNSSAESRPETPVGINYHQRQNKNSIVKSNIYASGGTALSGKEGRTSLVIKRGAGGTLVSDFIPASRQQNRSQVPVKKPKLTITENNNVITLNANALCNAITSNGNSLNSFDLTKYVQLQMQQHSQRQLSQSQNQIYLQQTVNKKKARPRKPAIKDSSIQINPKHMVPSQHHGTIVVPQFNRNKSRETRESMNTPGTLNLSSGVSVSSIGLEAFAKTFNHKDLVEVWSLLARAVYSTGCPLSLFENEFWKAAFKKIRPGLTLPTTDAITNSLLKTEYVATKKKMHHLIEAVNFVTVHCIDQSGSTGETFLSFFVNCSAVPSLYRVVKLPSSASLECGKISNTLDSIGPTKVLAYVTGCSLKGSSGMITDLLRNWEFLRSRYPGLITFACISQGLQSLMENVMKLDKVHKLCLRGKSVVDGIKNNPDLKKRFQEIQRELKLPPVPAFKFSNKCNWSSLVKCVALLASQKVAFINLLESEDNRQLLRLDTSDDSEGSDPFSLESSSFWTSITSATNLLVPLSNWVKRVEKHCSISEIPVIFFELKAAFNSNVDNLLVLNETEKDTLKKCLSDVKRLCMNELHLAACLLNPQTRSELAETILSADEEEEAVEFIHFFCETKDIHAETTLPELSNYRYKTGPFSKEIDECLWESIGTLDPLDWWNTNFPASALTEVASHLLEISSTLCTLSLPTPFDPESLFEDTASSLQNFGAGGDVEERLALVRFHLQRSQHNLQKSVACNAGARPDGDELSKINGNDSEVESVPTKSKLKNGEDNCRGVKNGHPGQSLLSSSLIGKMHQKQMEEVDVDFPLEEHEPMDVTQFLKQKTETIADGFNDEDEEEEDDEIEATLPRHDIQKTKTVSTHKPQSNGNEQLENDLGGPTGNVGLNSSMEIEVDGDVKVEQVEEDDEPQGDVEMKESFLTQTTVVPVVPVVQTNKSDHEEDNDDSSSTSSSSSSSSSSTSSSSSSSSTSNNEK